MTCGPPGADPGGCVVAAHGRLVVGGHRRRRRHLTVGRHRDPGLDRLELELTMGKVAVGSPVKQIDKLGLLMPTILAWFYFNYNYLLTFHKKNPTDNCCLSVCKQHTQTEETEN